MNYVYIKINVYNHLLVRVGKGCNIQRKVAAYTNNNALALVGQQPQLRQQLRQVVGLVADCYFACLACLVAMLPEDCLILCVDVGHHVALDSLDIDYRLLMMG